MTASDHNNLSHKGPVRPFLEIERRRLVNGIKRSEDIQGILVEEYAIRCYIEPSVFLTRIKELLLLANTKWAEKIPPSDAEWLKLLPPWFLEVCPDPTSARQRKLEIESELSRPYVDDLEWQLSRHWEPAIWAFWMSPDERNWLWWDGNEKDRQSVVIGIDRLTDIYPQFPGEFVWMCAAAGATRFTRLPELDDLNTLSSEPGAQA